MTEIEFFMIKMQCVHNLAHLPKYEFEGYPKATQNFKNGYEKMAWMNSIDQLIRDNSGKDLKFTVSWEDD